MKRFGIILLLLMLALSTLPAVADTSMSFTGVQGYNSGGVYTYAYYFTVDGTQNVPLMCDTYQNEISVGNSWTAKVNPITSAATSGGYFASQSYYNAAGLIYLGALGIGPTDLNYLHSDANLANGLANWAVWNLFDPSASSAWAQAIDNQALADVSANLPLLSNVYVYTPVPGSAGDGKSPQEFIGTDPVPEPGIVALLGFGLTSLLVF